MKILHVKPRIGMMFQNIMVTEGQKYIDNFDCTLDNMSYKIIEYIQANPTVGNIKIYGKKDYAIKFKQQLESNHLTNYANKPITVDIVEE